MKLRIFPLLLLTIFFLIACDTEKWLAYEGKDWSMKYPEGWEAMEQEYATFFMSPVEGDQDMFQENINVIVQQLAPDVTLETYTEITEAQLAQAYGDKSDFTSKAVKVKGKAAMQYKYSLQANAQLGVERSVKINQLALIENGLAYVVTFTALPDTYQEYEKKAEKMLFSFEVK